MINSNLRRLARLVTLALLPAALAACGGDGPNTPDVTFTRLELIVNSVSNTVTLVDADSAAPTPRTISLGAQGTPVGAAARGAYAVVPLGIYPFAAVLDLRSAAVTRTVALPASSGATGAGFLNDSIAVVANSNRNTVTPVNVLRGTAGAEIAVGVFPQAVVEGNAAAYVLNANLVDFSPAGPGSVSVVNSAGEVTATIPLTGVNPTAGKVAGNRLLVLNAGHFGEGDGSLSIVNLSTRTEEENIPGFGEFPGSLDIGPDGLVYVGVYGTGILVWNPGTSQFVRGFGNPLVPGGTPPVSALAFDYAGRLHTLDPGNCGPNTPGKEFGLTGQFTTVDRTVTTGICPFSITFANLLPAS